MAIVTVDVHKHLFPIDYKKLAKESQLQPSNQLKSDQFSPMDQKNLKPKSNTVESKLSTKSAMKEGNDQTDKNDSRKGNPSPHLSKVDKKFSSTRVDLKERFDQKNSGDTKEEMKSEGTQTVKKPRKIFSLNRTLSETKITTLKTETMAEGGSNNFSSRMKILSRFSDNKCDKSKDSEKLKSMKGSKLSPRDQNKGAIQKKQTAEKSKSDSSKSRADRIQASKLTKDNRQLSKTSITNLLFDNSNEHNRELMEQLNHELWGRKATSTSSSSSMNLKSSSKSSLSSGGSSAPHLQPHVPVREFRKYVRMNTAPALNIGVLAGNSSPKLKQPDIRKPMKPINFTREAMCTNEAFLEVVNQASKANAYSVDDNILDDWLKKVEKTDKTKSEKPIQRTVRHAASTNELFIRKIPPKDKFELVLPQKIKARQYGSESSFKKCLEGESKTVNQDKSSAFDERSEKNEEMKSLPSNLSLSNDMSSTDAKDLKSKLESGLNSQSGGFKSTLKVIFDYSDDDCSSTYHTPAGSPPLSHTAINNPNTGEESFEHNRASGSEDIKESTDNSKGGTETSAKGEVRKNLYPGCDPTIWLRSCTEQQLEPLDGIVVGTVPKWLTGSLIRNGPGRMQVGEHSYNHVFDGSALLHRFSFKNGRVTYQNRFLESESYLKDTKAQRLVVNYFGTKSHPDPCKTIMQNLSSKFSLSEQFTDNCQISLYPYGDGLYALTETPYVYRVDTKTLKTGEKVDLTKYVTIMSHTAHPHITSNATYNLGQGVGMKGPKYFICQFPHTDDEGNKVDPFSKAKILATLPCRWRMHPCYMHSFALTANYFVIIEQPLVVAVMKIVKLLMKREPMIDALQWWDKKTQIHVIRRDTGEVLPITYVADSFFFLHTINAYEEDGHIVLDIAAYKDASMLNCMFVEALKNAAYDPSYAGMFRGRPKRWVIPINPLKKPSSKEIKRSQPPKVKKQDLPKYDSVPECDTSLNRERINSTGVYSDFSTINSEPNLLVDVDDSFKRSSHTTYNESMDQMLHDQFDKSYSRSENNILHFNDDEDLGSVNDLIQSEITNLDLSVADLDNRGLSYQPKANGSKSNSETRHSNLYDGNTCPTEMTYSMSSNLEFSNKRVNTKPVSKSSDYIPNKCLTPFQECTSVKCCNKLDKQEYTKKQQKAKSETKCSDRNKTENEVTREQSWKTKFSCNSVINDVAKNYILGYKLVNKSKSNGVTRNSEKQVKQNKQPNKSNLTKMENQNGDPSCDTKSSSENVQNPSKDNVSSTNKTSVEMGASELSSNEETKFKLVSGNLTTLPNTKSKSYWTDKASSTIYVEPETLVDIGCEVPRINYEKYNGRKYQFFYAICSDVDRPRPGTLIKADVKNKTFKEWSDINVYPSEPIFVASPNAKSEDDGVVLSAVLRAEGRDREVFLLILDASSFTEVARVVFTTGAPVPKCLHGWFVKDGGGV